MFSVQFNILFKFLVFTSSKRILVSYVIIIFSVLIFLVRSHPTLEQLESLPVIRCLNGTAPPIVEVSEPMPQPPENEDDHIESAENNVPVMTTSLTEDVVEVVERTVVSTATNGYMKDVDLADEERDESR